MESITGLLLTILQVTIVKLMTMRSPHGYLRKWAVQLGAIFFFVSEVISILSESINVRRKITFERGMQLPLSKFKANKKVCMESQRFPEVRRIFAKYFATLLACICLVVTLPPIVSYFLSSTYAVYFSGFFAFLFIYIILHSLIFLKYSEKLWFRIISTFVILIISSAFIGYVIISDSKNHPGKYCYEEFSFAFYEVASIAVFLLPVSISNTAISGFHLKGCREAGKVTQDQVEFIEAAIIGTIVPITVIISSPECLHDIITILSIGFPQVAVLLFPILFEYTAPLCSMVTAFYIKSITWLA